MTDAYKADDQVLVATRKVPGRKSYGSPRYLQYIYDFEFRTLAVTISQGNAASGSATVIPFSAVDEEVLVEMRDRLIELGGNPRPLFGEKTGLKRNFPAPKTLGGPG
jgi:hypothetical protein